MQINEVKKNIVARKSSMLSQSMNKLNGSLTKSRMAESHGSNPAAKKSCF